MAIGTAPYPRQSSRGHPKGQGYQNPGKAADARSGLTTPPSLLLGTPVGIRNSTQSNSTGFCQTGIIALG
jgi:hypothetical protein